MVQRRTSRSTKGIEHRKRPADKQQEEEGFVPQESGRKANKNSQETNPTNHRLSRLWRDKNPHSKEDLYDSNRRNRNYYGSNRRNEGEDSSSYHYEGDFVGFSAVRASREAQLGRKGRIYLENTFTNLNRGWEARESIFRCRVPGLYYFSISARGESRLDGSYGHEDEYFEAGVVEDVFNSDAEVVEEARRRRIQSFKSREADRDACMDWKVGLMLNGETVVVIGGSNFSSAANSVLLPINREDRVWIQLLRGQLVEINEDLPYRGSSGITSFTGYRLGDISRYDSSQASSFDSSFDNSISSPSSSSDSAYEAEVLSKRRNGNFHDMNSRHRHSSYSSWDSRNRDYFPRGHKNRDKLSSSLSRGFYDRETHPFTSLLRASQYKNH